ncbi:MAG TPA: hypothetical protein VGI85_11610 [Chthoniobacterales bacterium]|jgi:hypothetical protein
MRGSPLFRAGLVVLALLALLWPLRRLTSHDAVPAQTSQRAALVPVHVVITSTVFPFRFSISHLGKVIWQGESIAGSSSRQVAIAFPPEGIDLLVDASWAEEKEAAVRVDVTLPNGAPISQTLWGNGRVDDVLTFRSPP